MEFKVNDRVVAVDNGYNFGRRADPRGSLVTHDYAIGWKGTVTTEESTESEWVITFDNGRVIKGCSKGNFELAKEEQTMNNLAFQAKPGDTVKVKGCTGETKKFNGETGKYLKTPYPMERYCHTVCFDGTGKSCGWLFADHKLEVVPQFAVGDKVMVTDGSYSMEFANGETKFSGNIVDNGATKYIYEITATNLVLPTDDDEEFNDTIIRRISDGRVFFVQQRFLKEYVAVPKFHKDQIVVYQGIFFKVLKVDDGLLYTISGYGDGCHAQSCIPESQLSEVDTK